MRQPKEMTAEWISERVQAILGARPRDEVAATMPALLMLMVHEIGFDNLLPPIQEAARRVFHAAGVTEAMSAEEMGHRVAAHLETLPVSLPLLRKIQAVFSAHDQALAELRRAKPSRFARPRALPALVDAPRPTGTLSLDRLQFPRRA